jgi:hypothetical protein
MKKDGRGRAGHAGHVKGDDEYVINSSQGLKGSFHFFRPKHRREVILKLILN